MADTATLYGKVLGHQHDVATEYACGTAYQCIGGYRGLPRGVMATGEGADLDETVRVAEGRHPLPGGQPAPRVLAIHPVLTAHGFRRTRARRQLVQQVFPGLAIVAHRVVRASACRCSKVAQ